MADILKDLEKSEALELQQRGDLALMDLDVTVQAIRIAISITMEAAA
ncbi:MAG: hypothetical protein U5L06_14190 [Rhodovibrio sp.]|nr:hypothetical protein [Rhodovibrio sp.]